MIDGGLLINSRRTGTTVHVSASGEIDIATASRLLKHATLEPTDDATIIVLDLAEITFIDSTGLHAILRAAEQDGSGFASFPAPLAYACSTSPAYATDSPSSTADAAHERPLDPCSGGPVRRRPVGRTCRRGRRRRHQHGRVPARGSPREARERCDDRSARRGERALDRDEHTSSAVLFELLNEMDGLERDADVIFLLSTNRADRLEPALAARPGRVDLAVELPLPDADGRRRLLELYGEGLRLRAADLPALVERSEGASPAFIRELLRRAALLASEASDGALIVDAATLGAALDELTTSGALTERLLGMRRE